MWRTTFNLIMALTFILAAAAQITLDTSKVRPLKPRRFDY
jgi:hypothetical protein